MMRYATLKDYDFICSLILKEAANGHFDRNLLLPAAARGLELELKSVLSNHRRTNKSYAYALIWERNGQPIGFVVMSALDGDQGNELWLAAVSPAHRAKGEGKEMISTILRQFEQQGAGLMARCAPESEAMFHLLTSNGFVLDVVLKKGTRQLMTRW
jgi:RimJ/RimL family protein N-acetyltransferase